MAKKSTAKWQPRVIQKRRGRPPYGYTAKTGLDILTPVDSEGEVIVDIVQANLSGESYTSIADRLNNNAVPTRSGRDWTPTVVRAIVQRETVA